MASRIPTHTSLHATPRTGLCKGPLSLVGLGGGFGVCASVSSAMLSPSFREKETQKTVNDSVFGNHSSANRKRQSQRCLIAPRAAPQNQAGIREGTAAKVVLMVMVGEGGKQRQRQAPCDGPSANPLKNGPIGRSWQAGTVAKVKSQTIPMDVTRLKMDITHHPSFF